MTRAVCALFSLIFLMPSFARAQEPLGMFKAHQDVGTVLHPGSASFDPATQTYTLRGSGQNIWLNEDDFQFAWKKMSGDVEITADISFANTAGSPHKKAVLMMRQSLDIDSPYVDVALHGNGLTALQYRDVKGGTTREVQSRANNHFQGVTQSGANQIPFDSTVARLSLTRRGDRFYVSFASLAFGVDHPTADWMPGAVRYDGESIRVPLQGDFYVGIGVCAHDPNAVEEARFSNVEIKPLPPSTKPPVLNSTLETVEVGSSNRQVVYVAPGRFEAPNWSGDGSYLFFNRDGHLEKLSSKGGKPEVINTGSLAHLNNDHGISPNGTQLAISDNTQETKSADGKISHDSLVYVLPIDGGNARQITKIGPSYWHSWSPDGKTLAFVGQRNGDFDIYTIPVSGGEETRLTNAKGVDDGPEYSPDGQYIYFNSERTGHMQIWRMKADGSEQEQVFADDYNNWFLHVSPDGKWMVFLTYDKDVSGHPQNKDVMLRLMSLEDKKISLLAQLFGGQGTINVPSWSPDSTQVAFVSYQFITAEDANEVAH